MKCSLALFCFVAFVSIAPAEITKITERGPNHRVFETVREIRTPLGVRLVTNQIVELQGGMHRWTEQGWVTSNPRIEVLGDNALVRNLPYGAIFAGNLATPGAIDLTLPEGRLTGHLLCLALTEGNRSVMIAEVKDCAAVIGGPEQNELIFADAFTDFDISVKYTFHRDRISQIVLLNQQLPNPMEWGLSENCVLEILTEFTAFPNVYKEPREAVANINTEHISLGGMEFVTGRAFSLGDEANSVIVSKRWELFEDQRSFVVEKIPWRSIAPELAKLPPVAKNWRKKDGALMARNQFRLPLHREARAATKPIQMADASPSEGRAPSSRIGRDAAPSASVKSRGYVIDWEIVSSVNSNLWKGDTTYYISGPVSIKTNIFEPNCVIKFAPTNSAKLTITGPVTCLTKDYGPLIMTSRDDHSVGEVIGSAALSGYSANIALDLDYVSAGAVFDLHDIRISHAQKGINFSSGRGHVARNLQLINCQTGIDSSAATFSVLNGIGYRLQTGVSGASSSTGVLQHVSFNQCSNLFTNVTLYATNSLLVACTNVYPFTGAYNGTNSDPATVFQTVGAGANYLTANSPFRDAGTTNIDANLLSSLKQLTTYPPIIAAQLVVLTNNLALTPQAARDSDTPDLGAHYSPIDFVFGGAYLENSTVTLGLGTAVAVYSPTNGGSTYYGIGLGDAAKLFSEGSPTNLNRIVRYNTVQEQWNTTWNTSPAESIISAWSTATSPETRFRFTEWSTPAAGNDHFSSLGGGTAQGRFTDCQFYGGNLETLEQGLILTNCLLHRVYTLIYDSYEISPTFRNCLFYGGTLDLIHEFDGTWTFKDNVFDRVTISGGGTFSHDYNGYITNAANQTLASGGGHDVFTNSFSYQTGALGRFYQPTNSIFIDRGSTNAHLLGLYHYTVLTNNTKETTSTNDIGFHYVATTNGVPIDTDGDGIPDYQENSGGSGSVASGETDWTNPADAGLKVLITRPRTGRILP